MESAIEAVADAALRSWEPQWSAFIPGDVRQQALQQLASRGDLQVHSWGGYPGAERQRLLLTRSELPLEPPGASSDGLCGVELLGNFLFDPAEADDFRQALLQSGVEAGALGDLWVRGDRGAQGLLLANAASPLDGLELLVRSVSVSVHIRPRELLQLPAPRATRRFSSVEASLRLDAVGSAGFGLSRNRMAELIRSGAVRLNWTPVTSGSKELRCGDRLQLQGKGELVLEAAELTKRNRWRVELLRQ
jgi:photosystem II S4 domain protein